MLPDLSFIYGRREGKTVREFTDLSRCLTVNYDGDSGVRIRIVTGYSGGYTVSVLGGDTVPPNFVRSQAEVRSVLEVLGMPPEIIEHTVARLSRERLVEVTV